MSAAKGKKRVENNRVKFPIGMTRARRLTQVQGTLVKENQNQFGSMRKTVILDTEENRRLCEFFGGHQSSGLSSSFTSLWAITRDMAKTKSAPYI